MAAGTAAQAGRPPGHAVNGPEQKADCLDPLVSRSPSFRAGSVWMSSSGGPPGVGQWRLQRRLTTILPALSLAKALETTHINCVAGLTGARPAVVTTRPCRAPHHPISDAGLIGGGHVPMPGEVSLAHHGVLFLEARPARRRHVLEGWRPPLEGGVVSRQSPAHHRSPSAGRPCVANAACCPPRETRGPHRVVP
jgi:hypothetical protein